MGILKVFIRWFYKIFNLLIEIIFVNVLIVDILSNIKKILISLMFIMFDVFIVF